MFQRKRMKNMCLITAASLFVLSLEIFIVVRYDVFINQQLKNTSFQLLLLLQLLLLTFLLLVFTTAYTVTSIVAVAGTVTVRVSDTATVTVTVIDSDSDSDSDNDFFAVAVAGDFVVTNAVTVIDTAPVAVAVACVFSTSLRECKCLLRQDGFVRFLE